MLKIEVVSTHPKAAAGDITAALLAPGGKPYVSKSTLAAHPGAGDLERRQALGALTATYLTASSPALLALPLASEKYGSTEEKIKALSAQALWAARDRRAEKLVFLLDGPRGTEAAGDVAEGLALGAYRFDKYKMKDEKAPAPADPKVIFVVPASGRASAAREVERRLALGESVNHARDLVNEPGSVATPAEIEAQARAVAKKAGLRIEVLDEKQLAKEGYEGLRTVGRGGAVPPRMIVLRYRPSGARAGIHLGLLGKGVTFDTGGVSIKPAAAMWEMKGDMSGAAAVLYALEAIAAAKVKLQITAIIVTAQNYVDAHSVIPGDVMRARNGKTIHIDNTDAEGRLILTDGLWRAGEEGVTHLVDVATLTGAIVRALGPSISGAFGNDRFVDQVVRVADGAGDLCWKMPLHAEYRELIKTDVADINNTGSVPLGGAIQAAIFLSEFLPEGISWTHLDIAGTFLQNQRKGYREPGATGVMVRALAALADDMAAARKGR